jgi:mono/diheme cytochrome c family protein
MNSTVRSTLTACLMLGAAGVAFTTGALAADAAAGKTLFATKCKACHGPDGTPPAAMAKMMNIKPMSDPSVQGKTDAVLKGSVLKGVNKMPAQKVTDAEADNLIAAVRAMK